MTSERMQEIVEAVLATNTLKDASLRLGRERSYVRIMCSYDGALRQAVESALNIAGRGWPKKGRPTTKVASSFPPVNIEAVEAAMADLRRVRAEFSR